MQTHDVSHTPAGDGSIDRKQSERGKKRVLLVEDDPVARLLLLRKLRMAGLEVATAADGRAGLEFLQQQQQQQPDAIVLELVMPGVTGHDLIKAARQNPGFGERPIYVCATASTLGPWTRRGEKTGATRVFDRTATSIDSIIADIAEELTGVRPTEAELGTATFNRIKRGKLGEGAVAGPVEPSEEVASPETVAAKELELPQLVAALRKITNGLKRSAQRNIKKPYFGELRTTVRAILDGSRMCGRRRCVAATQALQLFLNELAQKEERVSDSHLCSIALGVQTVTKTFEEPAESVRNEPAEFSAVLVEQELVVRAAVCNAFRRSCVKVVAFPTGDKALKHLQSNNANLVIFGPAIDEQFQNSFLEELNKISPAAQPSLVAMRELEPGAGKASFVGLKKDGGSMSPSLHSVELMLKCVSEVLNRQRPASMENESPRCVETPKSEKMQIPEPENAEAPPASAEVTSDGAEARLPEEPVQSHPEPRDLSPNFIPEDESIVFQVPISQVQTERQIGTAVAGNSISENDVDRLNARIAELETKLAEQTRAQEYLVRVLRDQPMVTDEAPATVARESSPVTPSQEAEARLLDSVRKTEELKGLLADRSEELNRAKAELEKRSQEQGVLEAENEALREALRDAALRAEAIRQERVTELQKLESEVASQRAEGDKLREELAKERDSIVQLEADWQRKVDALRSEAESTLTNERERNTGSASQTDQLTSLRGEVEALKARLDAEQKNATESLRWIEELENTIRNGLTERDALKANLEKLAGEKTTADSALRELREQTGKAEAKFAFQIEEMEKRLAQTTEALQQASEALVRETSEKNRLNEANLKTAGSTEKMETELSALRVKETSYKVDLSSRDRRVREGIASLARVTTELENERNERRRSEQRASFLSSQLQELHDELARHLEAERSSQSRLTDFEQQLREREAMVARINASLQKESAERQLVTEQLRSKEELTARLRQHIDLFEQAKQAFRRTEEELAARLEASRNLMSEKDANLQREIVARQKVEEALAEAHRRLEEQGQEVLIQKAKLESALHVEMIERKRLENDVLESRCASLAVPGVGQAFIESFCAQLIEPMENVLRSTRQLLEFPLEKEQKQLVESALQEALIVRTSLQESSYSNEEKSPRETTPASPTECSSAELQP